MEITKADYFSYSKFHILILAPPPLSIRENLEGESPNSSPLWHLNQSVSSINTSCSSNGIQNSPCGKGAMSPTHLPNPHSHQPPRHSLTSPSSMPSHNFNSNNNSDLNQQQKANVNSRGQNSVSTKLPSPMHQNQPNLGTHHRADHFTFSPNHISAETSSSIAYIGHGASAHYPYHESYTGSPAPLATSPPGVLPASLNSPAHLNKHQHMPSHMPKGSHQRPQLHTQFTPYTASSPIKNSSSSRENK